MKPKTIIYLATGEKLKLDTVRVNVEEFMIGQNRLVTLPRINDNGKVNLFTIPSSLITRVEDI